MLTDQYYDYLSLFTVHKFSNFVVFIKLYSLIVSMKHPPLTICHVIIATSYYLFLYYLSFDGRIHDFHDSRRHRLVPGQTLIIIIYDSDSVVVSPMVVSYNVYYRSFFIKLVAIILLMAMVLFCLSNVSINFNCIFGPVTLQICFYYYLKDDG
jgi:hypothetical protein